jgi:hypothetical protein
MSKFFIGLICLVSSLPLQGQELRKFHLSILASKYTSGNLANEFVAIMCFEGCPPVNQRNRWAGSFEAHAGYDISPTSSISVGFQMNAKGIRQKLYDMFEGSFFYYDSRWRYRGATVLFRTTRDHKKGKLFLEVGPWLDVLARADRTSLIKNVGGSLLVRPGIQYGPLQFGVQALAAFTNYCEGNNPPRDKYYPYSVGASVGWRW